MVKLSFANKIFCCRSEHQIKQYVIAFLKEAYFIFKIEDAHLLITYKKLKIYGGELARQLIINFDLFAQELNKKGLYIPKRSFIIQTISVDIFTLYFYERLRFRKKRKLKLLKFNKKQIEKVTIPEPFQLNKSYFVDSIKHMPSCHIFT